MSFRKTCGVVVLLVLWLAAGQSARASVTVNYSYADSTEFVVNLNLPSLETVVVGSDTFTRLVFTDAYPALLDSGKPEVPRVTVTLAIPDGGSMSFSVVEKMAIPFPIHKVYPQQPLLNCCEDSADFVYDTTFYQEDTVYPGADVDLGSNSDGHWRQLRVVRLAVYPVQVNPARDSVAVTIHLKVRVRHTGGVATAYPVPQWMVPLYSRAVDNFTKLYDPLAAQWTYEPGTKCLIICHQKYAGTKLPLLADWINRRGYETKVIYGQWPARIEGREAVKQLIQDEYDSYASQGATRPVLRWVLLVGKAHRDTAEIESWGDPDFADYGYTMLTDDGDSLADIGIARITPRDPADLDSIIDKILVYEKSPPTDGWLNRLDFVGSHLDSQKKKFEAIVRSLDLMEHYTYWSPDRDTIMGHNSDNDDVRVALESLSLGLGVLMYVGDGSDSQDNKVWLDWDKNGHCWTSGDVHDLHNGAKTPVVYNMACNCGNFSQMQHECLSEAWLKKGDGGGVASFAFSGTVNSDIGPFMCTTMVRALCDTFALGGTPGSFAYAPPVFDLGGQLMLLAGELYKAYPRKAWDHLRKAAFLGDPTMPVWSGGVPESVVVVGLPDTIKLDTAYSLALFVAFDSAGTRAVGDAQVCVCGAGVYEVARTNPGGLIDDLSFTPTEPGRLTITVSEGRENSIGPAQPHTPALPMQRTYYLECWKEMASVLADPSGKSVRWGAWLTYDDSSGLVFAAKGNNRADFYSYNPQTDTWLPLRLWPDGTERKRPHRGSAACGDGHGHIYAVKGKNTMGFWRYDADGDSWHQLDDVPFARGYKKVKDGTCVTYVQAGDTGYVYLAKGQTTEFFRYNTVSGTWSACQSIPEGKKLKAGSFLVYDGVGSIYVHKSSYDVMYEYSLALGTWGGPLAGMPAVGSDGRRPAKNGSCGTWLDGCIYALKGNNSRQFWQYFPGSDSWAELDTVPLFGSTVMAKRVKDGGSIVSVPELGFFAFKGSNCREYWYHPVPAAGGLLAGAPGRGGSTTCGPTLGGEEPLMDGLEASKPRWNWQGDMVCYSKEDTLTGCEQVYQCQYPVSSAEHRVVDMDEDCEEPVYSPDGEYIAFQLDDTVSGYYQLCVTPASDSVPGGGALYGQNSDMPSATAIDATGRDVAPLPANGTPLSKALGGWKATDAQIRAPASSPVSRRAVCTGPGLGGVAASLGPVWQVTFADEDHCCPEWSPDGEWLCYERDDANGYTQVWRVPAFGGTEEQLTFGNSDHFLPSYLDADEIVFTYSPNDGYDQVAKVHDSTYQVTVLSSLDTDHDKPSPAWDGSDVAAEAVDGSGYTQIVKVAGSAGSETWLTSGDADIMKPDYGQDNQSIFAVRWTGITSQIVRVDADSGGYTAVTDSLAIRDNPDAYVDSFVSNSMAVYEREAWTPGSLLLGGGKHKPGSGVYLSKHKKHHGGDGPQGASMGIFALDKARPNPATSRVTIRWQVPVEADVSLRVYNTAGQLVKVLASGKTKPGSYTSIWNGTDAKGRRLANGVYFYALDNGGKRISRKVVLTE